MAVNSGLPVLSNYDVPDAQATAYVVPVNVLRFQISQASVVNRSGAPVDFSIYLLQDGDAVADVNLRYINLPISAGETVTLFDIIGASIETNGIINAFASAASSLSLSVTGTTFT